MDRIHFVARGNILYEWETLRAYNSSPATSLTFNDGGRILNHRILDKRFFAFLQTICMHQYRLFTFFTFTADTRTKQAHAGSIM